MLYSRDQQRARRDITAKTHIWSKRPKPLVQQRRPLNYEITRLKVKNTKNCDWWSIGIDVFAGKNISKNEKKDMNAIAKLSLSNYPENNLISDRSYSYPKLFSLNREHK
jgi:hypothetical protein